MEIDTRAKTQVLSHQTVTSYFKVLEGACKFSAKAANKLFGETPFLKDISVLLPG